MSSSSLINILKNSNKDQQQSQQDYQSQNLVQNNYSQSIASGIQIESSEEQILQNKESIKYVSSQHNESFQEKPGSYRIYEASSCKTFDKSQNENKLSFDQQYPVSSSNVSDSQQSLGYKKYMQSNNVVNMTQQNNLICDDTNFSPSKNARKFRKQNTLDPDFDSPYRKNNLKQYEPNQQNTQNSVFKHSKSSEIEQPQIRNFIKVQKVDQDSEQNLDNDQQQQKNNLYMLQDFKEFIDENIQNTCNNNPKTDITSLTNDSIILQYKNLASLENTFFKSVGILHFKHMLYNDHIDIHNLSLFDLFERVKSKKMILKPSPIQHPDTTQEEITDLFCNNIYTLIKLKTQVQKFQLFQAFLDMIQKQPIFLESLMLMLKELVIETIENCESDPQYEEYKNLKSIINHTWIEMKPEFISLLSHTLNKQIEVIYILENRAEVMKYDKLLTRYNYEQTKMKLVYYHSNTERKSFYFPVLNKSEEDLFSLDKKEVKALQNLYMDEQTPSAGLSSIKNVKAAASKLFQENLFESNTKNNIDQLNSNLSQYSSIDNNNTNENINEKRNSFLVNTDNYIPNYQKQYSSNIPNLNLDDLKVAGKENRKQSLCDNNLNGNMFQKLQKHSNTMNLILDDDNKETHHIGSNKENIASVITKKKHLLKDKLKNELDIVEISEEDTQILSQQQIIDSKDVVSFVSTENGSKRQDTVISENEFQISCQKSDTSDLNVLKEQIILQKEHIFQKDVVSNKLQDFMTLFKSNSVEINNELQKQIQKNKENVMKENNNVQNIQQKQPLNAQKQNQNVNKNQVQQNNTQNQKPTLVHSNSQKKLPQRGSVLQQQQTQPYRTITGNILPQTMLANLPVGQQHYFPSNQQGLQYIYGQPQRMFINQ